MQVALPLLGGSPEESLLDAVEGSELREGCHIFETAARTAGLIVAKTGVDLEAATRDVYRSVLAAAGNRPLYRIWNYVPRINAIEHGLENYRRFCRARSTVFEEHFGSTYKPHLPAGSAVGSPSGPLAVAFLAGDSLPQHYENPRQVPAFEYPATYGPRSPSFSRATMVAGAHHRELFVSGTAAIRGHITIGIDDLGAQLACTRENLATIAATAGAGEAFGARDGWKRSFKVYIRRAADFAPVRRDLEAHLLKAGEAVTYLQADLCRAELLVEIEAVLTRI